MMKLITVLSVLLLSVGHYTYAQTTTPPTLTEETDSVTAPGHAKPIPPRWQRPDRPRPQPSHPAAPANVGPKALVFVAPQHIDVSVSTFHFKQPEKNKVIFQQNYPFEMRNIFGDNSQPISLEQRKAFDEKIKEIITDAQGAGAKHPWILVSESFKSAPNMREVIQTLRKNDKVLIFIIPSHKETRLAYHALKIAKPELKDENFVLWYGDTNRLSLAMKGKDGYEGYQGPYYGNAPKGNDEEAAQAPSTESSDEGDTDGSAYRGSGEHRKSWRERLAARLGDNEARPVPEAFKQAISQNQGKIYGVGDVFLALSKDHNHEITPELLQSLASKGDTPEAKVAGAILKDMNELGVTAIEVVPVDISQSFRDMHR